MVEWLNANIAYWHWIVIGLLLSCLEIFVPSFVMLWFGIAAILVGLIILVIPMSFTFQLLIWIAISVGLLVFWHKKISPRMKNETLAGLSREAIIGKDGIVLDYSSEQGRGKMRFSAPVLGNDEWEILSEETIQAGDRVKVTDLSGNTLIVKPK